MAYSLNLSQSSLGEVEVDTASKIKREETIAVLPSGHSCLTSSSIAIEEIVTPPEGARSYFFFQDLEDNGPGAIFIVELTTSVNT